MKNLADYLNSINTKDPMYKNHVLVVVKPGFQELLPMLTDEFIKNDYKVVKITTKRLQLSEAKELYKIHKKEDFYKDLKNSSKCYSDKTIKHLCIFVLKFILHQVIQMLLLLKTETLLKLLVKVMLNY